MDIALPAEPRWRLREAPLVYVLGQVVISPVLQMKEYIPKIQEELRKHGYPRFQENQIQDVIFGPQPQARVSSRWIFLNANSQESVIISNEFIALETSAYDTFEKFAKELVSVIEIVHKIVSIALIERTGLRYVNLIQPKQQETFGDYIYSGLLGLPENKTGANRLISQYELRDQSDIGGQLIVRFIQTKGAGFLPPDLEANHLNFKPEFQLNSSLTKGLLDIDHLVMSQMQFNPIDLSKTMWKLHRWTKQAFETSVVSKALEKWGREDINLN
jgi:uncharacterized protein (TIGR04255 family)